MNDEYEERGWFKQLVLILWAACVWTALRVERLWKTEWLLWLLSAICATMAIYGVLKLVMKAAY
jgi:hypothetical protein